MIKAGSVEELKELVNQLKGIDVPVQIVVTIQVEATKSQDVVVKPPSGVKPNTTQCMVTAQKSLAHEIIGFNNAKKPILEIYNNNDVNKRIKYVYGDRVTVYPNLIEADGGYKWYEIYGVLGDKNQRLYLDARDLIRV